MTIKDKALEPYYIESNYHGLTLYENIGNKKTKKIYEKPVSHDQLPAVIGDVVRRQMANITDTVTLATYRAKEQELHNNIMNALNPIPTVTTEEAVVATEEQLT